MTEFKHSKSITEPKLELLSHVVQKIENLSGCSFYTKKDTSVHYLSNDTFGMFVALMEAELRQLPIGAFFGGFSNFLLFMSA